MSSTVPSEIVRKILYEGDMERSIPLYHQIKVQLRHRIVDGDLPVGAALPSERELCEQYGVSRPTIRQATQELIAEGLLERRRGVGTFVAPERLLHQLASVLGFTERMEREGRHPTSVVIESRTLPPAEVDPSIAAKLHCMGNGSMFRLTRVRLADNEPILIETVHLPLNRFVDLGTIDFAHTSLYRTLHDRYGVTISSLWQTLEPILLDDPSAVLLHSVAGQPAMRGEMVTRDGLDQPIEHTISLTPWDRCQHYLEIRADATSMGTNAVLRQTHLEITV